MFFLFCFWCPGFPVDTCFLVQRERLHNPLLFSVFVSADTAHRLTQTSRFSPVSTIPSLVFRLASSDTWAFEKGCSFNSWLYVASKFFKTPCCLPSVVCCGATRAHGCLQGFGAIWAFEKVFSFCNAVRLLYFSGADVFQIPILTPSPYPLPAMLSRQQSLGL